MDRSVELTVKVDPLCVTSIPVPPVTEVDRSVELTVKVDPLCVTLIPVPPVTPKVFDNGNADHRLTPFPILNFCVSVAKLGSPCARIVVDVNHCDSVPLRNKICVDIYIITNKN